MGYKHIPGPVTGAIRGAFNADLHSPYYTGSHMGLTPSPTRSEGKIRLFSASSVFLIIA